MERLKKIEPQLLALLTFTIFIQIYMQSHFFSTKGDIYTQNLEAINLLKAAKNSLWDFFRMLLFERQDKGVVVAPLETPFLALGMSTIFLNQFLVILITPIFYGSLYGIFRKWATPTQSAVAALAMASSELIFKNIAELERYLFFLSFLPAIYFFWERTRNEKKTFTFNSVAMMFSMFICIGTRPFESFFIALGIFFYAPQVLRSTRVMIGFFIGGLWWALDYMLIPNWWNKIQHHLPTLVTNEWAPERLTNPVAMTVLALSFTVFKSERAAETSTRMLLLGATLIAVTLTYCKMFVDDYYMSSYILILFVLIRSVIAFEAKFRLKWRTSILALMSLIYFGDQAIAIRSGFGALGWAHTVGSLEKLEEPHWQQMRGFFTTNESALIAIVFQHVRPENEDIRPIWSVYQALAYRDHVSVEFTFPQDYLLSSPITMDEVCAQGIRYFFIMDPGIAGDKTFAEQPYLYENHPLPKDFRSRLEPLTEFSVGPLAASFQRPVKTQFSKVICK